MKKVFLVLALLLFLGVSAYAQGVNHNNDHDRVLVIIYPDHASAAMLFFVFERNSGFDRGNNRYDRSNNRYDRSNNRYDRGNNNRYDRGNNNRYDRGNNKYDRRESLEWNNDFKNKNSDNNNRRLNNRKTKNFDRW